MKISRNGLKLIPEKQMPEWARVASQAHKRATRMNGADWGEATWTVQPEEGRAKMMGISFVKRAELRQRGLPMIIGRTAKSAKFRLEFRLSLVTRHSSLPFLVRSTLLLDEDH